jgi:hypothetical protein
MRFTKLTQMTRERFLGFTFSFLALNMAEVASIRNFVRRLDGNAVRQTEKILIQTCFLAFHSKLQLNSTLKLPKDESVEEWKFFRKSLKGNFQISKSVKFGSLTSRKVVIFKETFKF